MHEPATLLATGRRRGQVGEIVRAALRVLSAEGSLVQYSYGVTSPLPARALGLTARRVAFAAANLPPATVWQFSPARP